MKPKQLANVLIKILGLSLCAHGITPAIVSVVSLWQMSGAGYALGKNILPTLLMGLIPIGIGIYLILQGRPLAEKLFKEEEE
jgi:hypothetical protein